MPRPFTSGVSHPQHSSASARQRSGDRVSLRIRGPTSGESVRSCSIASCTLRREHRSASSGNSGCRSNLPARGPGRAFIGHDACRSLRSSTGATTGNLYTDDIGAPTMGETHSLQGDLGDELGRLRRQGAVSQVNRVSQTYRRVRAIVLGGIQSSSLDGRSHVRM